MREPNTEIDTNPMENVDTPVVPEADDVRVVSDEGLRKLLATCDGGGFADVRDAAIIRLIENSTDTTTAAPRTPVVGWTGPGIHSVCLGTAATFEGQPVSTEEAGTSCTSTPT